MEKNYELGKLPYRSDYSSVISQHQKDVYPQLVVGWCIDIPANMLGFCLGEAWGSCAWCLNF